MPKIIVSLAQRKRSRSARACAACALRVRRVALHFFIINMIESLNFRHFRSF